MAITNMRYLKYICKKCTLSGKKVLVWYKLNDKGYQPRQKLIPSARCGRCDEEMTCRAVQKSQPRGGRDLSGALAGRISKQREMRPSALRAGAMLSRVMLEESKDEKKSGDAHDRDDPLYAPPAAFNPAMRLTSGSARRVSNTASYAYDDRHMKTTKRIRIAPSNMRMSAADPSVVMGKEINSGVRLPAAAHAGRPDYASNKFGSSEWCHLQGDCLGGPMLANNLVSASFAANTEMLAIEHTIMGHTEFEIEVVARCAKPHVALAIVYTVYASNGPPWRREIDACNDHFTKEDLAEVQESIRDFVTSYGHKRR